MTTAPATRVRPWQIWTITGCFTALLLTAGVLGATTPVDLHVQRLGAGDVPWFTTAILFLPLGALIWSRRPENRVGPLFVAVGILNAIGDMGTQYAVWALVRHPGSLPGGGFAAWIGDLLWSPALGLLIVAMTLFPTGRLPSRRWRWIPWTLGAAVTLIVVTSAIGVWSLRGAGLLRTDVDVTRGTAAYTIVGVVYPAVLVSALGAMVSLVVRYRRARDVERMQLKWLAVAVLFAGPALVIGEFSSLSANHTVAAVAGYLDSPLWMAVTATLAILRYRLYDIDRIVSRTVSYLVVTGALVGVYVACIVVTTAVFGGASSIRVAAATLAAAAAFQPVRRRVQRIVDRRFNRAKYDAGRTVDAFAVRLRDAVESDVVRADLLEVVRQALEPQHASLWVAR